MSAVEGSQLRESPRSRAPIAREAFALLVQGDAEAADPTAGRSEGAYPAAAGWQLRYRRTGPHPVGRTRPDLTGTEDANPPVRAVYYADPFG